MEFKADDIGSFPQIKTDCFDKKVNTFKFRQSNKKVKTPTSPNHFYRISMEHFDWINLVTT